MTKEIFISDMVSTYKSKDEDVNKAFYAQICTFAGKCKETHLEEVNDHIVKKHKFNTPFKLYLAYDFAEKSGYMIEVEKKGKKRNPIWLTCVKCGCNYSKSGRACPNCKNTASTLSTGEHLPDKYMDIKEDCSNCTIYPDIKENRTWETAINCEQYGKRQDAGCNYCQCKECCRQMMMYRVGHSGTIDKYRTGELGQPWLTDVKPINETVKEMVKNMKKGVDINNVMR
jgi:hypothetical protein